jgi:hypothetical protein
MTDHEQLALWAADCAERVLALFEVEHPNDSRPRNAIKATRQCQIGNLSVTEARRFAFAAHAAARAAVKPAAIASARSAGHAAATAHVATHAPHAARYALKAITFVDQANEVERDWQISQLPPHLRNVIS